MQYFVGSAFPDSAEADFNWVRYEIEWLFDGQLSTTFVLKIIKI